VFFSEAANVFLISAAGSEAAIVLSAPQQSNHSVFSEAANVFLISAAGSEASIVLSAPQAALLKDCAS
jgi:hypothetical protein